MLEPDQLRRVVSSEIETALRSLSDDARTVILLDLEGLTEGETAMVIGCAVGTVKSRLNRARGAPRQARRLRRTGRVMNCEEVRTRLRDFVKLRLDPTLCGGVGAHLEGCVSCTRAERTEHALDELLELRLPRFPAPPTLQRRLGLLLGRPQPARAAPRRWTRAVAPAMAAALAIGLGGLLLQRGADRSGDSARLTSELVNDHLRVLASQHPIEIESGGSHQVKPWFEGKLDFAPVVPAPTGGELTLRGGSVGYVFDRKGGGPGLRAAPPRRDAARVSRRWARVARGS